MEKATSIQIVKAAMRDRKWSMSKLAEESGMRGATNVTGILNRGTSMRVDNLVKMLDAMGYEVIVRDKMGTTTEYRVTDGKEA